MSLRRPSWLRSKRLRLLLATRTTVPLQPMQEGRTSRLYMVTLVLTHRTLRSSDGLEAGTVENQNAGLCFVVDDWLRWLSGTGDPLARFGAVIKREPLRGELSHA